MEEQKELCPSNNLAIAIVTTALGCLPLGIPAIVKAASVERLWNAGQKEEAFKAAALAKKLSVWGIVLTAIFWFIYIVAYGALIASMM